MDKAAFRVPMVVRSYELDALGHVNQAEYHHYAEHARLELFRHAGISVESLIASGVSPVLLESRASYRQEMRGSQEFEVDCAATFGNGKTFSMDSTIWLPDGTIFATVACLLGVLDLQRRRLIAEPRLVLAEQANDPSWLGEPVTG